MKKEFLSAPDLEDAFKSPELLSTVSNSTAAWNRFAETGKVEDYLSYCRAEGRIGEQKE